MTTSNPPLNTSQQYVKRKYLHLKTHFTKNCLIIASEHFMGGVNWYAAAAAAAKSLQSCPILCDPIDGLLPGSTIPGILQARTLEWVAISFSNAWKQKVKVKMLSLHNPMDCSLPGSSVHGIFQARVLEWGAIAFSAIFPRYMEIRHRVQWLWWTCLGTWTKVLS